MRAYSAFSEEAARAREFLKDWRGEGFLTEDQYQRMTREIVCELRRTNIFLRLVLFVFTLLIVGALVGLFFSVFLSHPTEQTTGIVLLILAPLCYGAAEIAATRFKLYRFGIEEALLACSVGFLCGGLQLAFFDGLFWSSTPRHGDFLVPAAGGVASIWIWHRFGLPYAPFAAMIFAAVLPGHWTSSPAGQRLIVAALYTASLVIVVTARPRYRWTYLDSEYSIAEALLWLGVYMAINLQLSPLRATDFARSFYWATWVLIWCFPVIVLARGLRRKDRFVIAAGAIAAILTLVTNKPYLGLERQTWDPMLLGSLMIGAAVLIRRWLAGGPDGIRHGFTSRRLSGTDKNWMNAGVTAMGFLSPNNVTPSRQGADSEVHFAGGDSGGGGATSDF